MPDVPATAAMPVAPVDVAPVVAVETVSAPEPPGPAAGAGPSTTPEPTPFPSADEFSWDTWDGEHGSLPEPVRGWGEKLSSHYNKVSDEALADVEFQRRTYEQLLAGHEDPRLTKMEADLTARLKEIENFKGSQAQWEQKIADAEARAAGLEAAWTKFHDDQATAYADKFAAEHPWLFDEGPIQEAASALMDDGFEVEDLPVLLRLPDATLARVKELRKEFEGAKDPGKKAIAMARSEARLPRNPAADVVSSGSRVAASPTDIAPSNGGTAAERLRRTVELELRKQRM